jgi:predicted regulator of Ras-like GTPase activity (Roadblock/LC7/MglB family)
MSAAMLSLGEQINKEVGLGKLDQLYTRGANGYVVLLAVGQSAVLTTLVKPEAKLGILFLELRKTAEDLAQLLNGSLHAI